MISKYVKKNQYFTYLIYLFLVFVVISTCNWGGELLSVVYQYQLVQHLQARCYVFWGPF